LTVFGRNVGGWGSSTDWEEKDAGRKKGRENWGRRPARKIDGNQKETNYIIN